MDPSEGLLQQAPNCTSQNVASNPRSLVQFAEQPHPLLQRRPLANCIFKYLGNRAHEEVVVAGGAAPHGRSQVTQEDPVRRAGHRGTTWAGGEGETVYGLRGRGSSCVWHNGGLEYRRNRPWGLVQHHMRKGVAGLWPRG